MLCKALKSFVSVVAMRKGDTKELDNKLATKFIAEGFVEAVKPESEQPAETEQPAKPKKARTRGGKANA